MRKAIILTTNEDTTEIRSLLDTLGVSVEHEFLQKRVLPHKQGYLGPGKLTEVSDAISGLNIELVVINGDLRPSQHHYLEMKFQKECIDRPGVILGIFASHAHTPEAIEQVKLAKLKYELPFLREWIHKAKRGDRPGFLAGGAYGTDIYYEHARSQARRIEKRLKELSKQREILRTKRHESGYALVSLSGYTNAGKSQLMNRACEATTEVDDRMFSTLSTTTRKVRGVDGTILMSDTVGFIRDLPPDLISAFKSTLEEIFYADMILLVIDVSESLSSIKMKLTTSLEILMPRIERREMTVVGNKIDKVTAEHVKQVRQTVEPIIGSYPLVVVSALTGLGIQELVHQIAKVGRRVFTIYARLPPTSQSYSFLSKVRANATVSEEPTGKYVEVTIKCRPEDGPRIIAMLESIGAIDLSTDANQTGHGQYGASIGKEGAPLG
jgi:GTP-binding protein HflX